MTMPLVMTGPGGDYVTRLETRGRRLVRQVGSAYGQQPIPRQLAGMPATAVRRNVGGGVLPGAAGVCLKTTRWSYRR